MRIGLNLLHILPEIRGGWNYLGGLLDALDRHGGEARFTAFVTSASEPLVPPSRRFEVVRVPLRSSLRTLRVLFDNSALALLAARHRVDTLHHFAGTLPVIGRVPSVVTIYDLLVLANPAGFRPVSRAYLHTMLPRTARRAAMLAPISQSTASELVERLGVDPQRMRVVAPTIRARYVRRPDGEVEAFRQRYGLPAEFWLCVAHTYEHKNYARLLAACARLREERRGGWPLVIRADPSERLARLVAASGIADAVIQLPPLPEREMPLLYSAASALVLPSLYEGAGLSLIEAMACGCPIAASSIPTTHEFAAGAALTFDPLRVESIAARMAELAGAPELRARCRAAGHARTAALRAEAVAAAFLDAHAAAAARPNGGPHGAAGNGGRSLG